MKDFIRGVQLTAPIVFAHEGGGKARRVCDSCLAVRDHFGNLEHADECPPALADWRAMQTIAEQNQ